MSVKANGRTVTLDVNCILLGRFIDAGDPIPAKDLPSSFKRYVSKPEQDQEQDQEPVSLSFQLGTSYSLDSRGNRHLQRQAAQLSAFSSEEDMIRQAIEEEAENPVVAAAMEAA